jgi:hypothetical protein
MKSADKIKRLFNSAAVQTNATPDEAVFETLKTAYTRTVEHKSAQRELSMWRFIMKSPLTKLAAAAVVVIACLIGLSLWRTTGSGIALADVLARVEQVKAFRCQWSTKVTGEDPNKKPYSSEARGTILTSQEYGRKGKIEQLDPNGGWSTSTEVYTFADKKTKIIITPKEKKYWRIELDDVFAERVWQNNPQAPRTFLKKILACKYESMGRATMDGIEVEGFQTTDPNFFSFGVGGGQNGQIDTKMWVDVKTRLPVRYDFTIAGIEHVHFEMHDLQWDVPVAAAEFKPIIPEDYASLVVKYPAHITEENAIQGLKLLGELLGKYPEKINDVDDFDQWDLSTTVLRLAEKSETPAALRLKEKIKGLTEDEIIGIKLVEFLMPIRGLASFYSGLQYDKKDPAYYGKTVTPKGADKILLRWKVSDNEYRVIFGDLHTQTVTAEALANLEKNLPK